MKIVVALDSFKGTLSSTQANAIVGAVMRCRFPAAQVVECAVADGGEGSAAALAAAGYGAPVTVGAVDPLGRPVEAEYIISDDGLSAFIDSAAASGLTLLKPGERNPLQTTSAGTGMLIADALRRGARHIYLGVGGTATNDGGAGILAAMGAVFVDDKGASFVPCGGTLGRISKIDVAGLGSFADFKITLLTDVDNPLLGPAGASAVFAPQKGATPAMVAELERNMEHYAKLMYRTFGVDIATLPGGGAGGGIGGGLVAAFGAEISPGAEALLRMTGADRHIAAADIVITGEGRMDATTLGGKTPKTIVDHARGRVVALVGALADSEVLADVFDDIICIVPPSQDLTTALCPEVAAENLAEAARRIIIPYKA